MKTITYAEEIGITSQPKFSKAEKLNWLRKELEDTFELKLLTVAPSASKNTRHYAFIFGSSTGIPLGETDFYYNTDCGGYDQMFTRTKGMASYPEVIDTLNQIKKSYAKQFKDFKIEQEYKDKVICRKYSKDWERKISLETVYWYCRKKNDFPPERLFDKPWSHNISKRKLTMYLQKMDLELKLNPQYNRVQDSEDPGPSGS